MTEIEVNGVLYDAILVKGQPRFRQNKKMVPAASLPEEVRGALLARLELERMEKAAVEIATPVVQSVAQPEPAKGIEVSAATAPEAVPVPPQPPRFEDVQPNTSISTEVAADPQLPTQEEMGLIAQVESLKERIFELEHQPTQIETDIFSLARRMYDEYGIWTVFVGEEPKAGDVHPFSGDIMTRYEVGVAYQQFKRASLNGTLVRDFANQKATVDQSRLAPSLHREEIIRRRENPHYNAPAYRTFAERTSVKGQNESAAVTVTHPNDPISEDPTVEPNLRGQIIREEW